MHAVINVYEQFSHKEGAPLPTCSFTLRTQRQRPPRLSADLYVAWQKYLAKLDTQLGENQ